MSEESKIECPPPAEWLKRNQGNVVVAGGRMLKGSVQLKYRNYYELIADPDVDALSADYGGCFARFCSAHYGYLKAFKADSGRASDAGGNEDSDNMPGSDFYVALSKRFNEQSNAIYQHAGKRSPHWEMLRMLMQPLQEGCDPRATRNAMFMIVPQINTALELLEEYSEDIQRKWKRANAPSCEDEERAR